MKAKHKIISSFNPKTVYANAGDPLKFIKNRGGVYIVQTLEGNKFSVTPDEVTQDENITLDDAPGTASNNKIPNRVSVAKTKKAKTINQQSFF